MAQILVFVTASIAILYISRNALRKPGSHGFYRFFAWEIILGLFALNLDPWFSEPLAWHQLISWTLLVISLYLVVHSVLLFRRLGKPDEKRTDDSLLGMEKTSRLIKEGVYRYIRHPMYSSLLFLAWGIFFKRPGWLGFFLALAATGFLTATAKVEEAENIRFFGEEYREYIQQTRMFIPPLF